jgi:hypothetical protein
MNQYTESLRLRRVAKRLRQEARAAGEAGDRAECLRLGRQAAMTEWNSAKFIYDYKLRKENGVDLVEKAMRSAALTEARIKRQRAKAHAKVLARRRVNAATGVLRKKEEVSPGKLVGPRTLESQVAVVER